MKWIEKKKQGAVRWKMLDCIAGNNRYVAIFSQPMARMRRHLRIKLQANDSIRQPFTQPPIQHPALAAAHVHQHVVPRWAGDTNFMPVLADVKVMPDFLHNTFHQIREQLVTQAQARGEVVPELRQEGSV